MPEILVYNTEIIGILTSVKNENNKTKLVFTIAREVEIPQSALPGETLEGFIGEQVGIFNCNGDYKVRRIKKK